MQSAAIIISNIIKMEEGMLRAKGNIDALWCQSFTFLLSIGLHGIYNSDSPLEGGDVKLT